MPVPAASLLEAIGSLLGDLPDVFSTPQWGGRAYKVPGPGGRTKRPKLLAFVAAAEDGRSVSVSFKLEPADAAASIDRYAWIDRHSFGTLGRSGWVSAMVTSRRQLGPLARLLEASRSLYPQAAAGGDQTSPGVRTMSDAARRIDRVMREARDSGWTPGDVPEAPGGDVRAPA